MATKRTQNVKNILFKIRGLAKCHRHGWIRTEILRKMVWSRDSMLSWRPFSCQISIFMPPPLCAHLTQTAKSKKLKIFEKRVKFSNCQERNNGGKAKGGKDLSHQGAAAPRTPRSELSRFAPGPRAPNPQEKPHAGKQNQQKSNQK